MRISDWSSDVCSSDLSLGHRCDGLRPQVLGVRARVAHPPDALHGSDVAEQLGEERSDLGVAAGLAGREGEVAPVAVHVLTEEGDLVNASSAAEAHLWVDSSKRPADLFAPHPGPNAKPPGVSAANWMGTPPAPGHPPSNR